MLVLGTGACAGPLTCTMLLVSAIADRRAVSYCPAMGPGRLNSLVLLIDVALMTFGDGKIHARVVTCRCISDRWDQLGCTECLVPYRGVAVLGVQHTGSAPGELPESVLACALRPRVPRQGHPGASEGGYGTCASTAGIWRMLHRKGAAATVTCNVILEAHPQALRLTTPVVAV